MEAGRKRSDDDLEEEMTTTESEARRALNRLRRALEKSVRELDSLEGAIRSVEGDDFPRGEYDAARAALGGLVELVDSEARRLQDKVLSAGGLEPGRVRRSSSS